MEMITTIILMCALISWCANILRYSLKIEHYRRAFFYVIIMGILEFLTIWILLDELSIYLTL